MRDTSSTYLNEGDRVRVTAPVMARGENLLGCTGTVTSAWSKCEEDPHCCCAELAEEGVALTVAVDATRGRFEYYFAEDELTRVASATTPASVVAAVAAATCAEAAGAASDVEPLLAAAPRRDLALALVFPLVAYKVAAVARDQRLMPTLDVAIACAVGACAYYCL